MDIESQLDAFADKHEIDYNEVEELYEEQLESVEKRSTDAIPEGKIEKIAYTQFRSEWNKQNSVEQDSDEIDIIALGNGGIREWSSGNTLLAYGIANPSDGPANKAVFIIDEEDVYLGETQDMFKPLASLKGNFALSESENVSDLYICNSTSDTEVMESDMDMSEDERHEWINENHITDRATLADITEHLSMTNDQDYPADFGGDIKRMQASITDWYIPQDWSFGVMTLQDESVVNPVEELDEEVLGDVDSSRDPGLTAWAEPEDMEYGEYSVVDLYGTITRSDDGQIMMNVFGQVPIMPTEIDLSKVNESGGDSEPVDTSTEETSI